jgi:hypothetical protein
MNLTLQFHGVGEILKADLNVFEGVEALLTQRDFHKFSSESVQMARHRPDGFSK